jgi:hypothetical protein
MDQTFFPRDDEQGAEIENLLVGGLQVLSCGRFHTDNMNACNLIRARSGFNFHPARAKVKNQNRRV